MAQTAGRNKFEKWELPETMATLVTKQNANLEKIDSALKDTDTRLTTVQSGNLPAQLTLRNSASALGQAEVTKNHSSTADYGTYLTDIAADGSRMRLIISALNKNVRVQYTDKDGVQKVYTLYTFT